MSIKLSLTKRLAQFVVGTSFENLTDSVIKQAKRCILDYLGCALAGYKLSLSGQILMRSCNTLFGCKKESTIIGSKKKVPAIFAALINSTMAYELELDDGSTVGKSHPGVTTIPAALALAEKKKKSGKDLMISIALGYDVNIRIGAALGTPTMERGFLAEAIMGPFGAAAAAGKLLDLNEVQLSNAFGILAISPIAPSQPCIEGGLIKDMYCGWSAMVGTYAALLAQRGFTGPQMILEGSKGIAECIVPGEYNFEKVLDDLGEKYEIMGVYFKPYACCRILHPVIDAILLILRMQRINPEDVKKIIVRTFRAASTFSQSEVKTAIQARNSIPYAAAVTMVRGKAGLDEFSEYMLKNPQVRELAMKVEVIADADMDRIFRKENKRVSSVEIELKDGERYSRLVEYPRGEPENPLTDKEMKKKFQDLASVTLDDRRIGQVFRKVKKLETLDNVNELIEVLSA